jgi:hypothetical protein
MWQVLTRILLMTQIPANAALKPTTAEFRFSSLNNRNGEFHPTKVCNTATKLNVGIWSSRASGNFEVPARNLTFGVSSNQAAW